MAPLRTIADEDVYWAFEQARKALGVTMVPLQWAEDLLIDELPALEVESTDSGGIALVCRFWGYTFTETISRETMAQHGCPLAALRSAYKRLRRQVRSERGKLRKPITPSPADSGRPPYATPGSRLLNGGVAS